MGAERVKMKQREWEIITVDRTEVEVGYSANRHRELYAFIPMNCREQNLFIAYFREAYVAFSQCKRYQVSSADHIQLIIITALRENVLFCQFTEHEASEPFCH